VTLFFALLFLALGILAIAPLIVTILGGYSGSIYERIDAFHNDYGSLLVSIGTLFLVSFLALFTTLLANRYADRRELSNREIQAQLKLSEFRQKWIDELRADLARLISITTAISGTAKHTDEKKLAILEMYELDSRIRLRLNPYEPKAQEIEEIVIRLVNAATIASSSEGFQATITNREKLAKLSSIYLKNEWDVLKKKLEQVESSVEP